MRISDWSSDVCSSDLRIPMMARLIVTAIVLAASSFGTAFAKSADPLQGLAKHMVRSIDFDLCLPADAIEYEALGKHAVIQLVTSTAIAAEPPLNSVYATCRVVHVTTGEQAGGES